MNVAGKGAIKAYQSTNLPELRQTVTCPQSLWRNFVQVIASKVKMTGDNAHHVPDWNIGEPKFITDSNWFTFVQNGWHVDDKNFNKIYLATDQPKPNI